MDTESFIAHVKTDDIYKDIAKDVATRFGTSNSELDISLKAKTYTCLKDDKDEDKKAKSTKRDVTKIKLKFHGYKNCL